MQLECLPFPTLCDYKLPSPFSQYHPLILQWWECLQVALAKVVKAQLQEEKKALLKMASEQVKNQIANLREEIKQRMQGLSDDEKAQLREELKGKISQIRENFKALKTQVKEAYEQKYQEECQNIKKSVK